MMGKLLAMACILAIAGSAQAQDLTQDNIGVAGDGMQGLPLPPDPMETSSVTYLVHTSPAGLMDDQITPDVIGNMLSDLCSQSDSAPSCAAAPSDQ